MVELSCCLTTQIVAVSKKLRDRFANLPTAKVGTASEANSKNLRRRAIFCRQIFDGFPRLAPQAKLRQPLRYF